MALTFTSGWESGTLGCTGPETTTTSTHSHSLWQYVPGPYQNEPLDRLLPETISSMDIEMGRVDEKYGFLPKVFKRHGDKYVRDPGRDRWIRKDVLASKKAKCNEKPERPPEKFKQLYNHDFHKLLDDFHKLLGK